MKEIDKVLEKNGWVVSDTDSRQVFSISGFEVTTSTKIYSRDDITSAFESTIPVFIFFSNLEFSTDISNTGLKLIKSIVKSESAKRFAEVLEERGLQDVQKIGSKTQRFNSSKISEMVYKSSYTSNHESVEIESRCYVFHDGESYYIVGYSRPSKINNISSDEPIELETRISEIVGTTLN